MNQSELLIAICAGLVSVLLGIVAWIGNSMVSKLEKISESLSKIEQDFGVLSNDHIHLKDEVKDIKDRVKILER